MRESGWDVRRRRVAFEIETAALRCFARDGYHAVTVEQIAQAAGIHERTFFRYFATKDEVMLALPRRSIDAICAALPARPLNEPLYDAFVAAVDTAAEALVQDEGLRPLSWEIFTKTPDLVARAYGEFGVQLSQSVAEAVAVRLRETTDSMRVGVMTAVLTGVSQYVWGRWMSDGAEGGMGNLLATAFDQIEARRPGPRADEIDRLRAELAELRVERDIFKRVAREVVERAPDDAA
jgi:AcrR family transcriptional regulator